MPSLTLSQRLEHAARVGSLAAALGAIVDVAGRTLLGPHRWRLAPWYVGRLGEMLRRPVRIDRATIHMPVTAPVMLSGELRLSLYEAAERYAVARFLPRDRPVLELGAGVGAVTCLINRLLIDRTRHWVVEANPNLLATLERTRRTNNAAFHVVHGAIAYDAETVTFGVDDAVVLSCVSHTQPVAVRVPAVTFRALREQASFQGGSLVADIEGAEADLIEREGSLIAESIKTLILEVHPHTLGVARVDALRSRLTSLGYANMWSHGDIWVMQQAN